MTRLLSLLNIAMVLLATTGLGTSALAQTPPQRLRGEVLKFNGHDLELKNRSGEVQKIEITDKTSYVGVVKADRSAIKPGVFVGIASVKGSGDAAVAEEVLVFPEAARGSNEGHYPWDLTPGGMMTNANISTLVESTNGPELTLSYKGKDGAAGTVKVQVPMDAPVVTFDKATVEDIHAGGHVMVVAAREGDTFKALRILVGKGIKPPM